MDEYIRTTRLGEKYNIFDKEYIRIMNIFQAAFFIAHGIDLVDAYPSVDRKTNKKVAVFVFKKEDTKDAYDEWCRRKESDDLLG